MVNEMNGFERSFPSWTFLVLSSVACFSVCASEDDFVVDSLNEQSQDDDVVKPQFQGQGGAAFGNVVILPMDRAIELQFEKMIFSQDGSVELGDQRIKAEREQAINALDRDAQLTDDQKRKLELAGQIDHQRFRNRLKAATQVFRAGLGNTNEAQREMHLLRAKTNTGLLGGESFFTKSIPVILDNNQLALINERKRSIHGGMIKKALRDFDSIVKLSEHQRESLSQIMLDEIPFDSTSESGELLASKSERMMMMYRLSCYANEKIELLFDAVQWQKVQPMLKECYHYRGYLVDRGLIDPDLDALNIDHATIQTRESK